MSSAAERKVADRLREQINTYNDTVYALICLGHVITWDDATRRYRNGTCFLLGRRMETSSANRIIKNCRVTPDLLVVISPKYGITSEAKPSFQGSVDDRTEDLNQLMKYDDDLLGWPVDGEHIETSDIVLLVHYSRKADAVNILDGAVGQGILRFSRHLAAVCFARTSQAQEYMSLEHFWGTWTEKDIQSRLRPLMVPLEKVVPVRSGTLYDAEPPTPLLLQLTWDHVFSTLVPEEDFQMPGKREHEIICTVDLVRDRLAEICCLNRGSDGKRQPEIPQKDWVQKMFNHLVKMKLARVENRGTGKYKVLYRWKRSPMDFFIKKCAQLALRSNGKVKGGRGRRRKSGDQPGQLRLF